MVSIRSPGCKVPFSTTSPQASLHENISLRASQSEMEKYELTLELRFAVCLFNSLVTTTKHSGSVSKIIGKCPQNFST